MKRPLVGLIGLVLAGTGMAKASELPRDFAEMRSAICDSTPTVDGCARCPAYMGERTRGALKFDSYVAGSFTSADADEVLLRSIMSCYAHVDGFSSAVLLKKMSGTWKRIAFYHTRNEMLLTGDCRKIPGQEHEKDLLVCKFFDWGAGSVAVISLDGKGGIAAKQELVTEWIIPFRELEPKICSTQVARIDKVSSDAIDISIQTRTYVPSPDCDADEENHKFEKFIAQYTRTGNRFDPTAATNDFLKEHSKRPD